MMGVINVFGVEDDPNFSIIGVFEMFVIFMKSQFF